MDCIKAQEALSARLDGEAGPPTVTPAALDRHLAACPACRRWRAEVEALSPTWRTGPAPDVPDLTDRIVDARARAEVEPVGSEPGRGTLRWALVAVALAELAVTVPVLMLGHDRDAPVHVAHEMGSFGLAVAAGLLVAAARPHLAAGLTGMTGAAAATLVATGVIDLVRGVTTAADEAPHLLVVAGAALLVLLARRGRPATGHHPVVARSGRTGRRTETGPVGLRLLRRDRASVRIHPASSRRPGRAA